MQKIVIVIILTGIIFVGIITGFSYAEQDRVIPDWMKTVLTYYLDDNMTDEELLDNLEFLASEGILNIKEKQYESFSKEKFPETGGFNPAWLEGEHDKIFKNCQESKKMGFESSYCKYLQ